MAYTLKTSGLALNLVHCFVVDTGAVVDAKGAATISSTTGCTFGTAQWRSATSNGSSHEYVQTNGTTGKIVFGTKPTFSMGSTRSIFIAFQGAGSNLVTGAGTAGRFCGSGSSSIGWGGWGGIVASVNYSTAGVVLTKLGADIYNKTTTQMALAFCTNGVTAATGYYDDDGGAMTDVTSTQYNSASAQTFQPSYWGANDSNAQPITHRLYCVAQFDKTLNSSEVQSLNEDWFGTLFQATGLTTKLKVKVDSSAASASSVAGVVFSAPSGSDITGAKIGEFTGKTFEASLESGQAVLKVPVSDFGGTSLTTSDTPVALVRNTSNTSGIVSCTVIQE